MLYFLPLLTAGERILILSSMDSLDDHCLVAEHGKTTPGTRIVLEKCIETIAKSDGREIFETTSKNEIQNVNSQLCFSKRNESLVLDVCRREEFSLRYNTTLAVPQQGGSLCVYATKNFGDVDLVYQKPGVLSNFHAKNHEISFAVDGREDTYFAASAENTIEIEFDFKEVKSVNYLYFDFVYPPAEFAIQWENDSSWITCFREEANFKFQVRAECGVRAKKIRILLLRPHPIYGLHAKRLYHGIASLKILGPGAEMKLARCEDVWDLPNSVARIHGRKIPEAQIQNQIVRENLKKLENSEQKLLQTMKKFSKKKFNANFLELTKTSKIDELLEKNRQNIEEEKLKIEAILRGPKKKEIFGKASFWETPQQGAWGKVTGFITAPTTDEEIKKLRSLLPKIFNSDVEELIKVAERMISSVNGQSR